MFPHLFDPKKRHELLPSDYLAYKPAAFDLAPKTGDSHASEGKGELNRLLQSQRGV
jgi:hypothetical protein